MRVVRDHPQGSDLCREYGFVNLLAGASTAIRILLARNWARELNARSEARAGREKRSRDDAKGGTRTPTDCSTGS
jgi:hypothetical protein